MTANPAQRVGLGLAALGRPVYITVGRADDLGGTRSVADLQQQTARVLDAAYAAGVRYLDCARSYGLSERFLAHWLGARPEIDDVVIASKWGYRYVGDWRRAAAVHEVKDHSATAYAEQLAATRAELGDRLAIYQIHSLTPDSPALGDRALHRRLGELRDAGVRVGFSTSGPEQAAVIRAALALRVGGEPLFAVVQSTWNLLEPSAGPALADAAEAGLSVVVKEGLANGRLAPGSTDPHPVVRAATTAAAELGLPLDRLALAAALEQPWAAWVLSGAVTPGQVASNVEAAAVNLPADLVQELITRAEPAWAYWTARSNRAWE